MLAGNTVAGKCCSSSGDRVNQDGDCVPLANCCADTNGVCSDDDDCCDSGGYSAVSWDCGTLDPVGTGGDCFLDGPPLPLK